MLDTPNDIPVMSTGPDGAETPSFPTSFLPRSPVPRVESLTPLAVASCPQNPVKRRASFLDATRLRAIANKLDPRAHLHRGSSFTTPRRASPQGNPTASTVRATRPKTQKQLTIRDPHFFLPFNTEAENVFDDIDAAGAENWDGSMEGVEVSSPDTADTACQLRAPPPTPVDPFSTPPQTPIRDALSAIGNSPQSISSSVRRWKVKKEMKIVQVFGPEAASAAKKHVTVAVAKR